MRENSIVWLPKEDLENLRPVEGAVPTSLHPRGAEHFILHRASFGAKNVRTMDFLNHVSKFYWQFLGIPGDN